MTLNLYERAAEAAAILCALESQEAMAFIALHPNANADIRYRPYHRDVFLSASYTLLTPYDDVIEKDNAFVCIHGCTAFLSNEKSEHALSDALMLRTEVERHMFAPLPADIKDMLRSMGMIQMVTRTEDAIVCNS